MCLLTCRVTHGSGTMCVFHAPAELPRAAGGPATVPADTRTAWRHCPGKSGQSCRGWGRAAGLGCRTAAPGFMLCKRLLPHALLCTCAVPSARNHHHRQAATKALTAHSLVHPKGIPHHGDSARGEGWVAQVGGALVDRHAAARDAGQRVTKLGVLRRGVVEWGDTRVTSLDWWGVVVLRLGGAGQRAGPRPQIGLACRGWRAAARRQALPGSFAVQESQTKQWLTRHPQQR